MSAQYTNVVKVDQFTRTMTGAAIPLSASSLPVCKATIFNRAGNAAVTFGHASSPLPISIAAGATYIIDVSAFNGMRVDLAHFYVNGTNTQVIDILYFT